MNVTIEAWLLAIGMGALFWLGALAMRLMVSYGQRNEAKKAERP